MSREHLEQYYSNSTSFDDKLFLVSIKDADDIPDRGTMAPVQSQRSVVEVAQTLEIVGFEANGSKTCAGVEMDRKMLDTGRTGGGCSIFVCGIEDEDVLRGQVLPNTGSSEARTRFELQSYLFGTDEDGRPTPSSED